MLSFFTAELLCVFIYDKTAKIVNKEINNHFIIFFENDTIILRLCFRALCRYIF